jgi:hypothetical protein
MLSRAVVALNATYAVPRPPARLTLNERTQQMAAYDHMMLDALRMPITTPAQRVARDRAISTARIHLAAVTNRRLNTTAISRIDALLGLPATDPRLGVQTDPRLGVQNENRQDTRGFFAAPPTHETYN